LTGDLEYAKFNKDSILSSTDNLITIDSEKLNPTEEELKLRESVKQEDKYNLFEKAKPKVKIVLFSPLKGSITEQYNPKKKHYAVDVAVPKNTAIKSVLGGTVIFADWTPSTGYVALLDITMVLFLFTNMQPLNVEQGDVVKTGEAIALAGSTGHESTGIHLHFELWKDGYPINPTTFIEFE
jgi:murein DD-endopeptidase MepM/ murein hydrolase activator NlpD